MKQVLLVHGMKRCGNHAIISWLKPHDNFIFFNNVVDVAGILRGSEKLPEPMEFREWIRQRLIAKKLGPLVSFRAATIGHRPLIASLEDHGLDLCPFRNPPCEVRNILLLRDARNLFASRIRKAFSIEHPSYPREQGPLLTRSVELWKAHAREYLGLTSLLEDKTCIFFNEWFRNQDYRRDISRLLGCTFTDRGFGEVSRKGGGSSFNKTRFDGSPEEMRVLSRYETLQGAEQELFESIFRDSELRELDEQVCAQPVRDHE